MDKKIAILLGLFLLFINNLFPLQYLFISKTFPQNGAIISAKNFENIQVYFSEPLDPKTVNIFTILFQKSDGDKIFGKIDYDNTENKIIFTPQTSLEDGTKYQLILKTGISALSGARLRKDFILSFKTADTTNKKIPANLLLSQVYPLPNSRGIPTDAKITITFQKQVEPASLNLYTFRVSDDTGNIYGDIEYDSFQKKATFTPIPELDPDTKYTIQLDKNITFSDGATLGENMEWTFYTKADEMEKTANLSNNKDTNNFKTSSNTTFNSQLKTKHLSNSTPQNNYLIHSGDLLNIIVYNKKGLKELGQKNRVYLDGTLTFPYAGTIYVEGKSVLDLKKELEKKLSKFYLNPTVNVWFISRSSKIEKVKITLIGAIQKKGSLKIAKNTNLIDVIAGAAPLPNANLEKVEIRRNNKTIQVDCSSIVGEDEKNLPQIFLEDGDIIFIPLKKTKNFYFYISGYIEKPGRYEYEKNMTILDAVYKAGGFSELKDQNRYYYGTVSNPYNHNKSIAQQGQFYYKIKIYRKKDNGEKEVITVSTKDIYNKKNPKGDVEILPGDFIRVEKKIMEKDDYVYLFGEVETQGRYNFVNGMTILDLLSYSGGVSREGKWVNVIRKDEVSGKDKVIFIDLRNLLHKGKLNFDVQLKPADIVFVSKIRYKNVFWKIGDYLNRSLFPGMGKVITLDQLLYRLKNLKVLK